MEAESDATTKRKPRLEDIMNLYLLKDPSPKDPPVEDPPIEEGSDSALEDPPEGEESEFSPAFSWEDPNYDTYDSCVVCAPDEASARLIHPSGLSWYCWDVEAQEWSGGNDSWFPPNNIKVTFLGVADSSLKPGVICSSYNAG